MKMSTEEQMKEIRLLAEQKLSTYKERVPPEDFAKILAVTMSEIAEDMGVVTIMPQGSEAINIVEIRDHQDLKALAEKVTPPPHVIVWLSELEQLQDELLRLGREGKVFSFFFPMLNNSVESIAASLEEVPVFVASSLNEAISVVKRFSANPSGIAAEAINGDQVLLRYLEGSPS